ncbi:MAG: FecR domain-containing protein, partial [Prevotella sp.]|nr:FecR domain-containing protein [Prevotella sp.]
MGIIHKSYIIMEQNNINILVSKYLLGTATPEELSALEQMKNEYPHIAELLEQLKDEDGFSKRYSEYMAVDKEKALSHFKEKMFINQEDTPTEETTQRKTSFFALHSYLLRIAAVVLCLIAVGAGWWYKDYTKVTPPEIAQEVRKAIEQSKVSGKNMARVETLSDIIQERSMGDNESSQQLAQAYEVIQENYNLEDLRRITTVHDREFWVTLDDGTLVHLNYNSKIIYPEKFGRNNREVILDGEAYFMVAKDRSRKFIVHTPDGDVTVHGTEFNINTRCKKQHADANMKSTEVVLVK